MDMDSARQDLLFAHFTTLADSLVNGTDVADLAHRIVGVCADLLEVGAAALLLDGQDGGLQVLAATGEDAAALEVLQSQSRTGPCHVAFTTAEEVVIDDVASVRDEWPDFVKLAGDQGIVSAAGVPVVISGRQVGALNLFRMTFAPLSTRDLQVARFLCSIAAIGVTHHRQLQDQTELAVQLRTALDSRVSIEQAKGVIAAHAGVSVSTAFELLRSAARASQRPLSDLAADVVAGKVPVAHLTGS